MTRIKTVALCAGVLLMAHTAVLPAARRTDPQYRTGISRQLTGTYELDRARSDDPQRAADLALRRLPIADRDRVRQQIEARLDPPEAIAIDRQSTRVTIASSRAPEMAFDVDGRSRREMGPRGSEVTTRASSLGDRVEVSVTGSRGADFTAIFEPLDYGQALRVTRRLMTDALNQPIEVRSIYRRTSESPNWDAYDEWRGRDVGRSSDRPVVMPDDTRLVATLDRAINVGTARPDDRLTLTVRDAQRPELDGATIEGYVTSAASRTGERTQFTLDFDQIDLRDGRTGNFSGVIESVRGPDGRPISFNGETVANDKGQKEQAIQRGAIGAAVGALIGAIAGGGKGAAVGAVLGGGGAAATVFIDDSGGSGSRTIPAGTEFTIRTRSY